MSDETELFRPGRGPVVLPSEEGQQRQRGLVAWIAALVVLVGAAAGLIHHHLWEDARSDATRLLPASTTAYAETTRPWSQLDRALDMDRWADPEALRHASQTSGIIADGLGGRVAGLPLSVLRRALLATDRIRVAAVPTSSGPAWLVIMALEDPWARRQLVGRLDPHLETVDRIMGYAVQGVRSGEGSLPWLQSTPAVHMVVMDDELVVGIGPGEALEELVKARVTGQSQPLLRRQGFERVPGEAADLWAWLDPGALANPGSGSRGPLVDDPGRLHGGFIRRVRSFALRSYLLNGDDLLELRIRTDGGDGTSDAAAFEGRPHQLPKRLPFEPALAVSASVADPTAALSEGLLRSGALSGLVEGPTSARKLQALRARLFDLRRGRALGAGLTGEVVFALPPHARGSDPSWVLALGVRHPERAEETVGDWIRAAMGPDWSYGTLYGEDGALHAARPDPLDAPAGEPALFWRRSGDVIVVAPGRDGLLTPEAWAADRSESTDRLALRQSTRALPERAPLRLLVSPALLREADLPWLRPVLDALRPGYRLAATVATGEDGLVVHANVGLWTLAAAFAALDRLELGGLILADLPEPCLDGWRTLCRARPDALFCEPFDAGRAGLVRRACARLGTPAE